jgi:hypothetical protein
MSLANIGDDTSISSISPPDGSLQAEKAAIFYPVARKAFLEMHPWGFATRRTSGVAMPSENTQWDYAYAVPNNALLVFAVLPEGATDDVIEQIPAGGYCYPFEFYTSYPTRAFTLERRADGQRQILTDEPNAQLRWIEDVTDISRYSSLCVIALARLLSSYLAGALIKGDVGRAESKGQLNIFSLEFSKAANHDVQQMRRRNDYEAPWLAARG